MQNLLPAEIRILRQLNTPAKIQNFLDSLPINFELQGETIRSPRYVLQEKKAHCIEAALLAATALYLHGQQPLIMDLRSIQRDDDHVITLFKRGRLWGAISKTNHATLRYREAIYRSPRELAVSFFHEYITDNGSKTLRSFSQPFNLKQFNAKNWMTSERNLWYIARALDNSPHTPLVTSAQARGLRPADAIEIAAGKLTEWRPDGRKNFTKKGK